MAASATATAARIHSFVGGTAMNEAIVLLEAVVAPAWIGLALSVVQIGQIGLDTVPGIAFSQIFPRVLMS